MFLDIFFPRFCIGCKTMGRYICSDCSKNIKPIKTDVCICCLKPSILGATHRWCNSELDGVLSIFEYKGLMKQIVKTIKYRLMYSVWEEIITLIPEERIQQLTLFKNEHSRALLQKIPLHTQKQYMRGFNQVLPFETYLNKTTQLKSINILNRIKNTKPQALIHGKNQRAINMQNAFSANSIEHHQTIVLLDDVYTTGSTCKEAARTLKTVNAKEIFAITLARG